MATNSKTDKTTAAVAAPPKKPPTQPKPKPEPQPSSSQDEHDKALASNPLLAPTKPKPDKAQAEAEEALYAQADKAAEAAEKAPKAESKKVVVRDYSDDKPNQPIESYKMPAEGRVYHGAPGKTISRRDSGVNRFAILVARPGGASESDMRHVNPRGFEYSTGCRQYVADHTGMTVVVRNERYQVGAKNKAGEIVPDETTRQTFYEALGGDEYLQRTVDFIRSNPKYPEYAEFELSKPLVAA